MKNAPAIRLNLAIVWIFSLLTTFLGPSGALWGQQNVAEPKQEQVENQPIDPAFEILTCGLSQAEIDAGWIALFDGKTLFGWKAESKADWRVEDGAIQVNGGERGLLRTTSQFDDYELRLKFKAPNGTNSGIFLRTSPRPTKPGEGGDCYEVNIAMPTESPFTSGTLVNRMNLADDVAAVELADQWHDAKISVVKENVTVSIDGSEIVNYSDSQSLGRGFIGLQLNSGAVAFKDIYLLPKQQSPMFNGKDLTGWKTDLKLESSFEVTTDGEMKIISGSGQIESEKTFGDFVFSTKCQTNAIGLNSGVFFRCIEGDKMNGYESQIQNLFKNNNPTQPSDCGTGGIFRRTVARRVNAKDELWFNKTIITTGPHIAVWVNGLQVTDWTDQRKPNANPRKGLRVEPGTIIFQGHDPTTDILFKDIRVKEMTKRNR